jgi:hypothetical protein
MKKGIKKWILYYMIMIHILGGLGTTGMVIYSQIYFPGIHNWILLLIVACANYFIFNNMMNLIKEIKKINPKN